MNYIILFFSLVIGLQARDCVPNTFTTLTYLMGHPIRSDVWQDQFFKDGSSAPSATDVISKWNQAVFFVKLKAIYAVKTDASFTLSNEFELVGDTPYLWLGWPSKETANGNTTEAHAAILYITDHGATLISTIKIQYVGGVPTFDLYIENITMDQLMARTLFIYQLDSALPIKYLSLSNLVLGEAREK
jgi:hypothetical protein